jgi:DNA-binding YbaB/EbfC family protein
MANKSHMLRQAQALQRKLAKAQSELAETEVSASAGGGMVTAVVTGAGEFRKIIIKPEAVDPDDVEMLADIIMAACNEALRKSRELENEWVGELAPGLGLPPGLL